MYVGKVKMSLIFHYVHVYKKKTLCVSVANSVDPDLIDLKELFDPIMVSTVCH